MICRFIKTFYWCSSNIRYISSSFALCYVFEEAINDRMYYLTELTCGSNDNEIQASS